MDLSEAELKAEQRKVVLWTAAAFACCTVVLFGSYAVLPGWFEFPTGLAERIAFTLQVDLFVFAWVVFALRQVAKSVSNPPRTTGARLMRLQAPASPCSPPSCRTH